jgi:general secretion pathway protein C
MFWLLRLGTSPFQAPPYAVAEQESPFAGAELSRLLGSTSTAPSDQPMAEPAAASRFQLAGVVAGSTPESLAGVALIAVDGKPARPYAVGARIDGDWVVQSVARRSVAIGPEGGSAAVVLDLPVLPGPTTGRLEPALMQQ